MIHEVETNYVPTYYCTTIPTYYASSIYDVRIVRHDPVPDSFGHVEVISRGTHTQNSTKHNNTTCSLNMKTQRTIIIENILPVKFLETSSRESSWKVHRFR